MLGNDLLKPLGGGLIAGVVTSNAQPAVAEWGNHGGQMVWGSNTFGVPMLGWPGLIVLSLSLVLAGVCWSRRNSAGLNVPLFFLALLSIPLAVAAGTVTIPYTFTNGTPADANEVNANFNAVKTAVDDNDGRIGTAQADANSALSNASIADVNATAAQNAAATALGTANSASASASSAQTAATAAQNTATTNVAEISNQAVEIAALQAAVAALQAFHTAASPRFEACLDGATIADHATGLVWEIKTGTFNPSLPPSSICRSAPGGCPDPRDINNRYQWSSTGNAADGNVYTDFLVNLNTVPCLGWHCDWRLPYIAELQSILVGPGVSDELFLRPSPPDLPSGLNATGQATVCGGAPCIDAAFSAVGGETAPKFHWSASVAILGVAGDFAWGPAFHTGSVNFSNLQNDSHVRAVRVGSCGPLPPP